MGNIAMRELMIRLVIAKRSVFFALFIEYVKTILIIEKKITEEIITGINTYQRSEGPAKSKYVRKNPEIATSKNVGIK